MNAWLAGLGAEGRRAVLSWLSQTGVCTNIRPQILAVFLGCIPISTVADITVLRESETPWVYAAPGQSLRVTIQNSDPSEYQGELRYRLLQGSHTVAAPVASGTAKTLRLLAGQTSIETLAIDIPPVNAPSSFFVQWLKETKPIGITMLVAFPTNCLERLKALAGESPLGVWDRDGQIQPLLAGHAVPFYELDKEGWEGFAGKMVLINAGKRTPELTEHVVAAQKRGIAMVLIIKDAGDKPGDLTPDFTVQTAGNAKRVTVRASFLTDWSRPQTQIRLLRLAELASPPQRSDHE
jgi:hypothetical protein